MDEKFYQFFNNLKYAAKVNLVFGCKLRNIEDGAFERFYAHENNTLLDRSNLVCTKDDLAKLKHILKKTGVIESCSTKNEQKVEALQLRKLTVFAAPLKGVPMRCKNAIST